MSEERLMKTPEEVKQKARELLQMPKEEVLTKYMFQEQEIERLKELCDKYEEEHKTTFETWQKDIKENEHLRTALNSKESIIKKAIEYANNIMFETKTEEKIQDDILEILDKESK